MEFLAKVLQYYPVAFILAWTSLSVKYYFFSKNSWFRDTLSRRHFSEIDPALWFSTIIVLISYIPKYVNDVIVEDYRNIDILFLAFMFFACLPLAQLAFLFIKKISPGSDEQFLRTYSGSGIKKTFQIATLILGLISLSLYLVKIYMFNISELGRNSLEFVSVLLLIFASFLALFSLVDWEKEKQEQENNHGKK